MALKMIRPDRPTHKKRLSAAEQGQRANRMILRRTLVLMVVCGILAFVPLIVTLYQLMIRDHDKYEELAINNQTRSTSLTASRGLIYDRNMIGSEIIETARTTPESYELQKLFRQMYDAGCTHDVFGQLCQSL